jgi:chromosomal replication initiator protein
MLRHNSPRDYGWPCSEGENVRTRGAAGTPVIDGAGFQSVREEFSAFFQKRVGVPVCMAASVWGRIIRAKVLIKEMGTDIVTAALQLRAGENMAEHREKWLRVQQRLRAELGDDLFNSWFARMDLETLTDHQLVLSVPTRFLKSWIDNHYAVKLSKIAQQEFEGLQTVTIKVRNQGQAVPSVSASVVRRPVMEAHMRLPDFPSLAEPQSPPPEVTEQQTFDTFVVGTSNQLAHAAALRVAQSAQGQTMSFNPLYVYSPAGYGKTHLLQALAHKIRAQVPQRRVTMMTAERFMYGFIQAVRQRDTLSFKDQFQNVDVLLIDDFQFLQGKAIQQEFCHSFNALVDARRQVVIAADVPPAQLDGIDQRMRSRILGGLVVDIEAPDQELRRRIVAQRHALMIAKDAAHVVPSEVLDMIAEKVNGGGRELEGALTRILAYQQFNNRPITADLAAMVLREAISSASADQGRIKIDDILKVVGRHYNVGKAELLSPRRARTVVVPRQVGMYLAKKLTARSLPEIGRRFGGRDHSTVLHAVRKIDEQVRTDERLAKDIATLIKLVEQQ